MPGSCKKPRSSRCCTADPDGNHWRACMAFGYATHDSGEVSLIRYVIFVLVSSCITLSPQPGLAPCLQPELSAKYTGRCIHDTKRQCRRCSRVANECGHRDRTSSGARQHPSQAPCLRSRESQARSQSLCRFPRRWQSRRRKLSFCVRGTPTSVPIATAFATSRKET